MNTTNPKTLAHRIADLLYEVEYYTPTELVKRPTVYVGDRLDAWAAQLRELADACDSVRYDVEDLARDQMEFDPKRELTIEGRICEPNYRIRRGQT